jgi:hypothetical protein
MENEGFLGNLPVTRYTAICYENISAIELLQGAVIPAKAGIQSF